MLRNINDSVGLLEKTQQFVKVYTEEVKNEIKSFLPGKKKPPTK
jgi:hypothetical protein